MVAVLEDNTTTSYIVVALAIIASTVPTNQSGIPGQLALYNGPNGSVNVTGTGFTYDGSGHLTGGTIASISYATLINVVNGVGTGAGENYASLSLPVPYAISLASLAGGAASTLLAGNDSFQVYNSAATGYGGDDIFTIVNAIPTSQSRETVNMNATINGGGGVNTALFSGNEGTIGGGEVRSAATVTGGGGNETVAQYGITTNLVSIDKVQFVDGSIYEDNATHGAQAALAFEGILGRLPDPINAGGYGRIAEQTDTQTAARAMLATTEGQADTANLSNADFVARLYQNMLHRGPDAAGAAGWQANLDTGLLDRGTVVAAFTSSIEAQTVNFAPFASGTIFAADPNAVETLRAYEILLTRLPEASALSNGASSLDNGSLSLQQLYTSIQGSAEFRADAATGQGNPYGLIASSSFAAIHGVALSDQVTSLITPLVTSNGVAVHS